MIRVGEICDAICKKSGIGRKPERKGQMFSKKEVTLLNAYIDLINERIRILEDEGGEVAEETVSSGGKTP